MTKATNDKRLKYLKESVQHAIVRVDMQQLPGSSFGHFDCQQFDMAGGVSVYEISIDPATIKRTQVHIREDSVNDYFLTTLLDGAMNVTQAGQKFTLEPGQLALMTSGQPYTVTYKKPSRRLIVRIPNQLFRERLANSEECVAIGSLPQTGLGRVVVELIKSIAAEASRLPLTDQYTLTQSLLELTGALTRTAIKPRQTKRDVRHAELFSRILSFLEQEFTDNELTPEKIARANGISTRYLHSLFRQSGTTVQRWVWERRLRAARKDLLDPSMAQIRISNIAFQRGFADTAHFSRSFRNRFGISPSKLRNLAAESAGDNLTS